jgi:hypothetical protein
MTDSLLARLICSALVVLTAASHAPADDKLADKEREFYRITTFEVPKDVVLEPGAFQWMSDGRLAVSSRRGEIWLVRDPLAPEVKASQFTRFAHGLHEVLGLAEKDGWLYVTQRDDVSRIKDTNKDDVADVFEVVNDDWGISGDYHEYAFGSKFDKVGNLWVVLCLTGSFSSEVPYRGWCLRITPDGKMIPTTSGIRSPGGIGFDADGEPFYTDNQGPWNGTCGLKHLTPGRFVGHPGGWKWYDLPAAAAALGKRPTEPESGGRMVVEREKVPELEPVAVLFPYAKMGQSASGVACDVSGGKFGPFQKQIFVGDQTFSTVMRCFVEKVNGVYQGACFPFKEGFGSGVVPVEFGPSGAMFVGGTNRGWGSRGTKPFSVERLDWTGKTPFEIHEMRAAPDGFELTFTLPVDPKTAGDVASYEMKTHTYIYQSSYGSPEVDPTTAKVVSATVGPDNQSVRLKIDSLQRGHVHTLTAAGVRSEQGAPLLHAEAYYTLNEIPKESPAGNLRAPGGK